VAPHWRPLQDIACAGPNLTPAEPPSCAAQPFARPDHRIKFGALGVQLSLCPPRIPKHSEIALHPATPPSRHRPDSRIYSEDAACCYPPETTALPVEKCRFPCLAGSFYNACACVLGSNQTPSHIADATRLAKTPKSPAGKRLSRERAVRYFTSDCAVLNECLPPFEGRLPSKNAAV
jgi:hypothetical protein